jgi:hypothetical protein
MGNGCVPTLEQLLPLRHEVGERAGVRWCFRVQGQSFGFELEPIAK